MARTATRERLDFRDLLACKDPSGHQGLLDQKEPQDDSSKSTDLPAHKVRPELPETQDPRAPREAMAQTPEEDPAPPEMLATRDPLELLAHKVLPASKDRRESPALASIAHLHVPLQAINLGINLLFLLLIIDIPTSESKFNKI
jgi:hypothetical protein